MKNELEKLAREMGAELHPVNSEKGTNLDSDKTITELRIKKFKRMIKDFVGSYWFIQSMVYIIPSSFMIGGFLLLNKLILGSDPYTQIPTTLYENQSPRRFSEKEISELVDEISPEGSVGYVSNFMDSYDDRWIGVYVHDVKNKKDRVLFTSPKNYGFMLYTDSGCDEKVDEIRCEGEYWCIAGGSNLNLRRKTDELMGELERALFIEADSDLAYVKTEGEGKIK